MLDATVPGPSQKGEVVQTLLSRGHTVLVNCVYYAIELCLVAMSWAVLLTPAPTGLLFPALPKYN